MLPGARPARVVVQDRGQVRLGEPAMHGGMAQCPVDLDGARRATTVHPLSSKDHATSGCTCSSPNDRVSAHAQPGWRTTGSPMASPSGRSAGSNVMDQHDAGPPPHAGARELLAPHRTAIPPPPPSSTLHGGAATSSHDLPGTRAPAPAQRRRRKWCRPEFHHNAHRRAVSGAECGPQARSSAPVDRGVQTVLCPVRSSCLQLRARGVSGADQRKTNLQHEES